VDAEQARQRLQHAGGHLRRALEEDLEEDADGLAHPGN
jgi:hypothetical protein